jgi:hypothetical protein
MAPKNIVKLRKEAIKAGMDASEARTSTRKALEDFISNGNEPKRVVKKKAKAEVEAKPARKTRKPAPADKSDKGKAKRRAAAADAETPGRLEISKINYADDENWNPRVGSVTEKIFRALKRHKDNVEKTLDFLADDYANLTPSKRANGEKLTKAERMQILKYRINRTRFDFAVKTGQHEPSKNRVEYGTGNGRKPAPEDAPRRRGRPPKAKVEAPKPKASKPKAKPKATKASESTAAKRMKDAPKRGPGRPRKAENVEPEKAKPASRKPKSKAARKRKVVTRRK